MSVRSIESEGSKKRKMITSTSCDTPRNKVHKKSPCRKDFHSIADSPSSSTSRYSNISQSDPDSLSPTPSKKTQKESFPSLSLLRDNILFDSSDEESGENSLLNPPNQSVLSTQDSMAQVSKSLQLAENQFSQLQVTEETHSQQEPSHTQLPQMSLLQLMLSQERETQMSVAMDCPPFSSKIPFPVIQLPQLQPIQLYPSQLQPSTIPSPETRSREQSPRERSPQQQLPQEPYIEQSAQEQSQPLQEQIPIQSQLQPKDSLARKSSQTYTQPQYLTHLFNSLGIQVPTVFTY